MFIDPFNAEHSLPISIVPSHSTDFDYPTSGIFTRLMGWLRAAVQRRRERLALASLSDHVLKDIGVSRSDVEVEMFKPFWRR